MTSMLANPSYLNLTDELSYDLMNEAYKRLWFESLHDAPIQFWSLTLVVQRDADSPAAPPISFGGPITDPADIDVAISNAKRKYARVLKVGVTEWEMSVDSYEEVEFVGHEYYPVT